MTRLCSLFLALGAACVLGASPAAQEAGVPPDTTEGTLGEVVVEALRTPLPVSAVPYAVAVAAPLPGAPARGLDEVLAGVPGVQVYNRFNDALGERIVIRGFGARSAFGVRGVRVVVDGIPATFADGQSALSTADPLLIERAEVVRGPASVLYGNAAGGVILFRRAPIPEAPLAVSSQLVADGDGRVHTYARAGGTRGRLAFDVGGGARRTEGFREHSASEQGRLDARLRYSASSVGELWGSATYVGYEAENPGSLSAELLEEDREQAFERNLAQQTGEKGRHAQVGLGWRRGLGGWGTAEVSLYGIRRTLDNPIPFRIIALDRLAGGVRAVLRGEVGRPERAASWVTGVDLDLQWDDRQNYANEAGERGALALDQDETVTSAGAFAQALFPLAHTLDVAGGLRYDRVRFHVDDRLIGTEDPDDSGAQTMDALSPSLGLVWRPRRVLDLYANVATAFETPTTTELVNRPSGAGGLNPDLDPQRTVSVEVGARARLGRATFSVAAYDARISSALVPFEVPDVPDRVFFRNAGAARHRGIEAALTLAPFRGLGLSASAAYTDARFLDYVVDGVVYDGNRVPGVAPFLAEVEASFTAPSGWFAAVAARAVTRTVVDDANEVSSPGYALLDLRAGHGGLPFLAPGGWADALEVFGGVTNVLDARYNASVTVNAFGGRYYEPGPGRTVYVGVAVGLHAPPSN